MEVEFQGQYDKNTFFKAVTLANKPSRRSAIIRVGLTILCTVIFIAYFIVIADKRDFSSFDIIRTGRHFISIPILAYFLLQPYISAYVAASNIWKDPSTREPLAGIISSQGVAYISSTARRDIAWEEFARMRKTDNLIVLLTADGTLSTLPRSFFKDDNAWRKVQQWAEYRVVEAQ